MTIEHLIAELHRAADRGLGYQTETNVEQITLHPSTFTISLFDRDAKELDRLEREMDDLETENRNLEHEVRDLEREVDDLRAQIDDLTHE